MARSPIDYLTKQWYDSIAGTQNTLREMEKAVNFSGELNRVMKNAMGLDLDLKKAMGLNLAEAMGSIGRVEELAVAAQASKAMGLDLDLKKAMGLNLAEAMGSVGRVGELTATQGMIKSYLLRTERQFVETARRSFLAELDLVHLRVMEGLALPLDRLGYSDPAGISGLADTLAGLHLGKTLGTASWARASFEALVSDLYVPGFSSFHDWIEEELEFLLLSTPEYTQSKLAWILEIFVPRLRLALYRQEQEGDFDGAMEEFWEVLVQDPEVRSRLRERLEKVGIREELRQHLSSHLGKIGEGELVYAILGLYAHIEAFLAELAVQQGLIPHPEFILCPKSGKQVERRGVSNLIEVLHRGGKISQSQQSFLNYVLSNQYDSNRVRHGMSLQFSPARATTLVLALILALCLAWGMEPAELLQPEKEEN